MSVSALAGLSALNLLYLIGGNAVVWSVRGLPTRLDLLRNLGVGYLCGVALAGVAASFALVLGVRFSLVVLATVLAAMTVAALAIGYRQGRSLPLAASGSRFTSAGVLATAAGIAGIGLLLETLFRAARLHGLYAWDAWSFWIPKAKALYYFGGFDRDFLANVPAPSYPPLIPLLDAAAFHFMRAPDVVTLHVQYWMLTVGFAAAVTGILSRLAPAALVWPFGILALAVPRASERLITPQADFTLDFFFVTAVLLVFAWLRDGDRSSMILATILLCGVVLTKREGLLLAACLFCAAGVTLIAQRSRWRPLAASLAVVTAAAASWRVWVAAHDLPGDAPPRAGFGSDVGLDRFWDSLRLALEVFFDDALWGVLGPLALAAVALAFLARAWLPASFAAVLLGLILLGGAWITWSFPELPITAQEAVNPIVRFTAAAILAGTALTPPLLAAAWRPRRRSLPPEPVGPPRWLILSAPAATVGVLLAYPAILIAQGKPAFPSQDDCARSARQGATVDVVFGRFDRPAPAEALAERVLAFGFRDTEVAPDGCGRWEVVVRGRESIAAAREVQSEAQRVGFRPRLEEAAP